MLDWFKKFITWLLGEETVEIPKTHYNQAMKNLLAAEQMAFKLNRELMEERVKANGAYTERNMCIALIARFAMQAGCKAGLGKDQNLGCEPDWKNIVYIELPTGQVSWHIHDSEMYLFDFLPVYDGKWDGHTTAEKYNRVLHPGF